MKWLDQNDTRLLRPISPAATVQLRKILVDYAANDQVADYGTAEQVYFGLESASYALGDLSERKAALDPIYRTISDSSNFSPQKFAEASKAARTRF